MFVRGDLEGAKELYLEAIGVEADCVEAIFNLGEAHDTSAEVCQRNRTSTLVFVPIGRGGLTDFTKSASHAPAGVLGFPDALELIWHVQ